MPSVETNRARAQGGAAGPSLFRRDAAPLAISLALHVAALLLIAPWLVMRSIPAPPVEVEVMIEQALPEPPRREARQTARTASAVRPQAVAQAQPRPPQPQPEPRPTAAPRPMPTPATQPGQGLPGRAALAARETAALSAPAAAPSAGAPRSTGAAALQTAGNGQPGPAQTRTASPGSTPQPSARSFAASTSPGENRQDGPLALLGPAAQVQAADPEFRQAARQGGQTGMRGGSRALDDGLARQTGSPDQTALLAARAVPPPGQGSAGAPGGQLAAPPAPAGAGQGRVAASERAASDAGRLAAAGVDPVAAGTASPIAAGSAERGGSGDRGTARSAGPAERGSGFMQTGAPEAVGTGAAVAGGGPGASAAGEGRALQRAGSGGGVREGASPLVSAGSEGTPARDAPALEAGRLSGRADGASAAQAARETRPAALQTQVARGEARVVEERFSAPALKVDSPRSICELPLMFAGFDRKPIPKGLDSINATAASLPDETPPRHHPGNQLPRYPFQALVSRAEGRVVVRAEIQPDGQVGQSWIKQTSGAPTLDQAALETVRGWRFHPAQRHGMAVAMWLDVPIEYKVPEGVIR